MPTWPSPGWWGGLWPAASSSRHSGGAEGHLEGPDAVNAVSTPARSLWRAVGPRWGPLGRQGAVCVPASCVCGHPVLCGQDSGVDQARLQPARQPWGQGTVCWPWRAVAGRGGARGCPAEPLPRARTVVMTEMLVSGEAPGSCWRHSACSRPPWGHSGVRRPVPPRAAALGSVEPPRPQAHLGQLQRSPEASGTGVSMEGREAPGAPTLGNTVLRSPARRAEDPPCAGSAHTARLAVREPAASGSGVGLTSTALVVGAISRVRTRMPPPSSPVTCLSFILPEGGSRGWNSSGGVAG